MANGDWKDQGNRQHTGRRKSYARPEPRIANQRRTTRQSFLLRLLGLALAVLIVGSIAFSFLTQEKPVQTLTVATGPIASDSYELMREVADVVARQSDSIRLRVVPTGDSSRNISTLNRREADLAVIRADTPVVADIRMVATLFPDYFQIIARDDSAIFNIRDLNGKKVAIPAFGTNEFRSFWAVGDHYDLPISGVKWRAVSLRAATSQLLNGEVDAIFTVRSLRDRTLLNLHEDALLKRIPLKLLAIEQAPAIAIKRPFLSAAIIPKGAFGGEPPIPRSDTISSSVDRTLVTRSDVDAALINELTSILFEYRLDLVIRFALASAITQPSPGAGLTVPMHQGAESYYRRDEPSFLQENAEPIALIVTLFAMLGSGLIAIKSRLTTGQKNRMDSYNYILLDIAERARTANSRPELSDLKNELYGILETVVRALDTDEVTEEGFQSFSLLWESVREAINDRGRDLAEKPTL